MAMAVTTKTVAVVAMTASRKTMMVAAMVAAEVQQQQ
jgi:hypothetical protein